MSIPWSRPPPTPSVRRAARSRTSIAGLGAALSAVVLLVLPGVATASPPSTVVAPYHGTSSTTVQAGSTTGCGTGRFEKTPFWSNHTGRLGAVASASAPACGANRSRETQEWTTITLNVVLHPPASARSMEVNWTANWSAKLRAQAGHCTFLSTRHAPDCTPEALYFVFPLYDRVVDARTGTIYSHGGRDIDLQEYVAHQDYCSGSYCANYWSNSTQAQGGGAQVSTFWNFTGPFSHYVLEVQFLIIVDAHVSVSNATLTGASASAYLNLGSAGNGIVLSSLRYY